MDTALSQYRRDDSQKWIIQTTFLQLKYKIILPSLRIGCSREDTNLSSLEKTQNLEVSRYSLHRASLDIFAI